jgi:AraC family transcriptional regulator
MTAAFTDNLTHGIEQWTGNKVLAQSRGRGWHNLNATLATVNSWSGTLDPVQHYCLAFCLNGPARLRRVVSGEPETGTVVVLPRQFLIIPAYEASQWQRLGTSEMLMLYLRHELLTQTSWDVFGRDGLQIALRLGATDPLLEQLAMAVLHAVQAPDSSATSLYVDCLAVMISAQLLRAHSCDQKQTPATSGQSDRTRQTSATPGLLRLRDFVESSLDKNITLDMLAHESGLSIYLLPRAFKQQFGASPHQYVLDRRLALACSLLANTDRPITEVALETGFSSQSHLTSTFKKRTGVTPNGYRRAPTS